MSAALPLIVPDWPAPPRVRAAMSTRQGGVSRGAYASLNLGIRVGDDPAVVAENRRRLIESLRLPSDPSWLRQVHGTRVLRLQAPRLDEPQADAAWTDRDAVACVVQASDCLPVLLCDRGGSVVAAAHAGWRGLVAGVLEATVRALPADPGDLLAWLGPAIGPTAFEVGDEVREAFLGVSRSDAAGFRPSVRPGHWLANLPGLARARLQRAGIQRIFGGRICTYGDPGRYFSFRRDGTCGRMAAVIWLISGDPGVKNAGE